MLAEVYRGEWDADALLASRLLGETRAIFGKAVDKGTPRSTPHRTAFKRSLKTSTDVFSAFRVHRQAADVAALLTGDDGQRVPFGEWAAKAQPYLNHQNRAWLMTEYSTAVRRAHDEADWQRFREDADIYPNLEWVPSTSAHPGGDHRVFWGTVLPVSDPFWASHRPGDRWNCKCSLRPTDRPATAAPRRAAKADGPQPGLAAKPGSGEVFSSDHPYFPKSCADCPFGRKAGKLRLAAASLAGRGRLADSCYECPYRAACEEEDLREVRTAGGKVRIHARHGKNEAGSNTRTATFLAEKHGYEIDLLPDLPDVKSADSYNRTLLKEQEYKDILTPTQNAVEEQIKKAHKQAASIVLNIAADIDDETLTKAVKARVSRHGNITDVTIIRGGKDATFTREQILSEGFEIKEAGFH